MSAGEPGGLRRGFSDDAWAFLILTVGRWPKAWSLSRPGSSLHPNLWLGAEGSDHARKSGTKMGKPDR